MYLKKNITFLIEQKKLNWLIWNPKALVKYNLTKALILKNQFNYLINYYCSKWLIRTILKNSRIIGVGSPNYYSFGTSKKQKNSTKSSYIRKLLSWKDSWFFFGLILKSKKNFLNSTITVRNVFYNEVIEKTFFLFNIRNTLIQTINNINTKQLFFKKKLKKKSTIYYIWSWPRVFSKITLL